MKIQVKLFANIRTYLPDVYDEECMDVPDNDTVEQLIARLDIPDEMVKVIFVNNRRVDRETVLKAGDRVGIFPPVAGG